MIDLEVEISAEELKQKLNITDGVNGSPDTPTEVRDKLEMLQEEERLDKKAVKGLEDIESEIDKLKRRPVGGGMSRMLGDQLYSPLAGVSKALTYNGDGTLNTVTDSSGVKTMGYTAGVLTSLAGTGFYRNKTFTYSGGVLTAVTVS